MLPVTTTASGYFKPGIAAFADPASATTRKCFNPNGTPFTVVEYQLHFPDAQGRLRADRPDCRPCCQPGRDFLFS